MPFFAVSTSLITSTLCSASPDVKQVWLADDASAAGNLQSLVSYFDSLSAEGKKFGYYVNEKKSWLILKNEVDDQEAKQIFKGYEILITTKGERHLGAL